jgi:hypothetical protein
MNRVPREEPYDVLDGFFADFDQVAAGEAPGKRPAAQVLGYASALLIGIALVIVILGTLAWIGALVFNQLLTQVG